MTSLCVCDCLCFVAFANLCLTAPSMFGRDLVEQVQADSRNTPRDVPVLVEKCIDAVEELGKSTRLVDHHRLTSGQLWTTRVSTAKQAVRVKTK